MMEMIAVQVKNAQPVSTPGPGVEQALPAGDFADLLTLALTGIMEQANPVPGKANLEQPSAIDNNSIEQLQDPSDNLDLGSELFAAINLLAFPMVTNLATNMATNDQPVVAPSSASLDSAAAQTVSTQNPPQTQSPPQMDARIVLAMAKSADLTIPTDPTADLQESPVENRAMAQTASSAPIILETQKTYVQGVAHAQANHPELSSEPAGSATHEPQVQPVVGLESMSLATLHTLAEDGPESAANISQTRLPETIDWQPLVAALKLEHLADRKTLTVKLRPDELGHVQILFEQSEQGFRARILSDNPQTTQLLGSQVSSLQETLSQKGMICSSIEVVTDQQAFDSHTSRQHSGHSPPRDPQGRQESLARPVQTKPLPVSSESSLPIRHPAANYMDRWT